MKRMGLEEMLKNGELKQSVINLYQSFLRHYDEGTLGETQDIFNLVSRADFREVFQRLQQLENQPVD